MSSRVWFFRIEDILEALGRIDQYTQGIDFDQFKSDQRTIDAVVRNLEIIGEAASHIPELIIQNNHQIPWKYMKAMRNLLIHEYFGVNVEILWQTVKHDLPPLKNHLGEIIQDKQSKDPLI